MPVKKWETVDDDGCEITFDLPATYEVCRRCEGEGTHVNPNIDGHGITSEEWERDWDDESRQAYFEGRYDVTCHECDGQRVTLAVSMDALQRCDKALYERYVRHLEEEADYRALCAAEREYGC